VWQLAKVEFSHLAIEEPAPTRETWVIKKYPKFSIKYKPLMENCVYNRAYVDLELAGRSADVVILSSQYGASLREIGATVVAAGKSAAFRMEVPRVSPPQFDEDAVRSALCAWSSLVSWWERSGLASQLESKPIAPAGE